MGFDAARELRHASPVMHRYILLFAGALALAPAARAQDLRSGEVLVRVETPLGQIDLAIDTARAK
jgi:hypothetical protein